MDWTDWLLFVTVVVWVILGLGTAWQWEVRPDWLRGWPFDREPR